MSMVSRRVQVRGHLLHQVDLPSPEGVPTRAALIFFHGQGDHAERYEEILLPLRSRGIRCLGTDLLGHGRSPGVRGDTGSESLFDTVVMQMLSQLDTSYYGVMGHSMGGLLALRHLILAGQGRVPKPSFAWLSSPLLSPSYGRGRAELWLADWMASLWPTFTLSTGVRPEMCRIKNDDDALVEEPKHRLWHSRVSLRWANFLLKSESFLAENAHLIPKQIRMLITQGEEDPVCRPEQLQPVLERLPVEDLTYQEFPGLLHEPFSGEGSERLFEFVDDWLDGLNLPNQAQIKTAP